MKYFTTILVIFFLGCQNNSQQKGSTENSNEVSEIIAGIQETEISGNEPEPVIINSTYIIRTDNEYSYGLPLKYEPNDDSVDGSFARLGEKLYVVEVKGNWLKVWANIHKDRSGKYYSETIYSSLYIKKEFTGKIEQLLVSEEELPVITDYRNNERTISEDTLSFRLISKDEYLIQKTTTISHIVYDTLNVKKTNGELTLLCTEKTVVLTDIDNDSDSMREYIYIGQIPLLNVYLVKGRYFESSNYFFVNKDSGETTNSFGEFPALSPDGKYIVSLWGNPYESYTEFAISKLLDDNTSENLFFCIFKNWMPFNCAYDKEIDYFWGNDNLLYVKIQTVRLAGQIYEEYAAQYMKVKIGIIETEKI